MTVIPSANVEASRICHHPSHRYNTPQTSQHIMLNPPSALTH
jgi:hypothetical protein